MSIPESLTLARRASGTRSLEHRLYTYIRVCCVCVCIHVNAVSEVLSPHIERQARHSALENGPIHIPPRRHVRAQCSDPASCYHLLWGFVFCLRKGTCHFTLGWNCQRRCEDSAESSHSLHIRFLLLFTTSAVVRLPQLMNPYLKIIVKCMLYSDLLRFHFVLNLRSFVAGSRPGCLVRFKYPISSGSS